MKFSEIDKTAYQMKKSIRHNRSTIPLISSQPLSITPFIKDSTQYAQIQIPLLVFLIYSALANPEKLRILRNGRK